MEKHNGQDIGSGVVDFAYHVPYRVQSVGPCWDANHP